MKRYQIQVNGQSYAVEIEDPNASPATVIVNGQTFQVSLSETGTASSSTRGRTGQVELEEVYVPTVTSTFVDVEEPAAPEQAATAAPAPGAGTTRVTAPMPGKILDIVVKPGARVKHGDTMCSLEAMKMKSPIRAPADGTVVQILISEGQNVNFGDSLFTLQ